MCCLLTNLKVLPNPNFNAKVENLFHIDCSITIYLGKIIYPTVTKCIFILFEFNGFMHTTTQYMQYIKRDQTPNL